MKYTPVNLSSPVLPLISSCPVYWCTFVSGTFSPDPSSACLRTRPVSASLSGASPACCLGRWTHWEPEVRGSLKQVAFWKYSLQVLGFCIVLGFFVLFFCFCFLFLFCFVFLFSFCVTKRYSSVCWICGYFVSCILGFLFRVL